MALSTVPRSCRNAVDRSARRSWMCPLRVKCRACAVKLSRRPPACVPNMGAFAIGVRVCRAHNERNKRSRPVDRPSFPPKRRVTGTSYRSFWPSRGDHKPPRHVRACVPVMGAFAPGWHAAVTIAMTTAAIHPRRPSLPCAHRVTCVGAFIVPFGSRLFPFMPPVTAVLVTEWLT